MTLLFCTPFTLFDEAQAYMEDSESQLVYYYLSPLPDNGEAGVAPPVLPLMLSTTLISSPEAPEPPPVLSRPFFRPPRFSPCM